MKKNLGKIVLYLILITELLTALTLKTDKLSLVVGDELSITISVNSTNSVLPALDNIAGYDVLNISSSSSTTIINSNIKHIKSRTYTIKPTSDFTIPALEVMVNGTKEFTKPVFIKVLKTPQKSTKNSEFLLELVSNKKEVKVGESFEVKVIFKRRVDTSIDKIALDELEHDAFWIKKIGNDQRDIDGDYEVYTRSYLLFAQKEGDFKIENLLAKVGVLKQQKSNYNDPFFSSFFQRMVFKNIYSNSLDIHVIALPNNLEVYGDFTLKASVDKTTVASNKPINLLIKIEGEGNIEDIKKFNLQIPNATIFADKPQTKLFIRDGKQYGVFTQKIAIISDANFTVPPILFSYYSDTKKAPVTKKTKLFNIEVKGSIKKDIKVEKSLDIAKTTYKIDNTKNYIYFISGLFLGLMLSFIIWFLKRKEPKKNETPLVKKIKKTKNSRELYNLLLPLTKDSKIKTILEKLEENIYKNSDNKIDKKYIIEILKEYE